MRRFWQYIMVAAVLAASTLAWGQDAVVATVNGQPIKDSAFTDRMRASYGYVTLEQMIEETAIQQAADKAGIKITDAQVTDRVKMLAASVEARSATTGLNFESWLAGQGLTYLVFKAEIRLQLLVETMVKDKVNVTQAQVSDFYTKQQQVLAVPEQVRVSHICVKTKEEAEKIRADILAGKVTFADAARDFSIDPYSKNNGGELGPVPKGDDPLQVAAFALAKDGDISPVVQTRMGFHIIKRDARMTAHVPPFEDVEKQLRAYLERQELIKLAAATRDEILKAAQIDRKVKLELNGPPADLLTPPAEAPGKTAPAPTPAPAPK
jgi:foldase protein PrsA